MPADGETGMSSINSSTTLWETPFFPKKPSTTLWSWDPFGYLLYCCGKSDIIASQVSRTISQAVDRAIQNKCASVLYSEKAARYQRVALLMEEVCMDVTIEPVLQPLTGETFQCRSTTTDEASLDICANGFWGGRSERTFFNVRIFNPNAPSNHATPSAAPCYQLVVRTTRL